MSKTIFDKASSIQDSLQEAREELEEEIAPKPKKVSPTISTSQSSNDLEEDEQVVKTPTSFTPTYSERNFKSLSNCKTARSKCHAYPRDTSKKGVSFWSPEKDGWGAAIEIAKKLLGLPEKDMMVIRAPGFAEYYDEEDKKLFKIKETE